MYHKNIHKSRRQAGGFHNTPFLQYHNKSSHGTFETQDDGAHDETSHGEPCILVCQRMSTVSKEGPCGKETWRKETI